jgi:hypothetical protein
MGSPKFDDDALRPRKVGKEKEVLGYVEDGLPTYGAAARRGSTLLEGEIYDERYETTKRGMTFLHGFLQLLLPPGG